MTDKLKGTPIPEVRWASRPASHDFPAAASYLSLLAEPATVAGIVDRLRNAQIQHFKAKDILRAARLELLDATNPHVASDLAKIQANVPLSPILLVRGNLAGERRLHVADGYHRVCACYHTNENTDIPCLLVDP